MLSRRAGGIAALAAAATLGFAKHLAAQLATSLDAGLSWVEYDGFLPSGAMSLTPAIALRRPGGSVAARGSVLRFESGNHSVQAVLTAAAFTRAVGRFRGEVNATAGASSYRQFPGFGHALGRARLHWLAPGRGGWIAAGFGQTVFKHSSRPVTRVAAGTWRRRGGVTLDLSATHTAVGDTTFTDIESAGHWPRRNVEINGLLGVRAWSRGGGRGVYGEANANVRLGPAWTLVLGAGRYPTDPTRGSVSGRYFTAGIRLSGLSRGERRREPPPSAPGIQLFRRVDESGEAAFTAAAMELRPAGGSSFEIAIRADWAQTVEIMGDFTAWEPVALTRDRGEWRVVSILPPGIHRLNIRLDGGAWTVPMGRGIIAGEDDFGGRVGRIVVP